MLAKAGRRHVELPSIASDTAVVFVTALLQVGGTFAASRHQHTTPSRALDAFGVALLLAPCIVLFVRRRAPEVVLTGVFAFTLLYDLLGYPKGPIFVALIVAFYANVMYGRRWYAVTVLALGYFGFVWLAHYVGHDSTPSVAQIAGVGAWLLVLWSATEMIRVSRGRAADRERVAAESARRLATDERLRIAREIHDVVAHNISMINVQAGVGLHLMEEQPDQAALALANIKDASRETLRELRSVLGVLRDVDGNGNAPRSPLAGLAKVEELMENARRAGLVVQLDVRGERRPLPTETDLAAYRILQESITNVVRHAGAHVLRVGVEFAGDSVTLVVDDDGRGPGTASVGSGSTGIAGMRERAMSLGGALEIERSTRGGVRVVATLPIGDEP